MTQEPDNSGLTTVWYETPNNVTSLEQQLMSSRAEIIEVRAENTRLRIEIERLQSRCPVCACVRDYRRALYPCTHSGCPEVRTAQEPKP